MSAESAAAVASAAIEQHQHNQHNQVKLEGLDAAAAAAAAAVHASSAVQQPATAAVAPAQSVGPASPTGSGSVQTCKWSNPICREAFQTPEDLYQHLTEVHVGRKSNNNLNLTCRWENCNTTVIKRDHITSHLRVHVALKPHTCPKCQKSFKRPQDLKKHIKTHAEDSANGQGGAGAGYAGLGQGPSGFYGGNMPNGNMNFPFQQQTGGHYSTYPPTANQLHNGFGASNAYWAQPASGAQTSFSLGGLLDAHRSQNFVPTDYTSFRPQLEHFEALHQPQYPGAMSGAGAGGVAVAGPYHNPHELAQSIRTKNDLTQVHAMLKEMQRAAMNHQPDYAATTNHFAAPGYLSGSEGGASPPESYRAPSISSLNHYSRSDASPSPSLTPGSSVHSYTHSPAHDHVLPLPSTSAPAVSYPSLPGATSGAVGAGLGSQYDVGQGYRQYNQRLGKAQASDSKKEGSGENDATLDPALRALGGENSSEDDKERHESDEQAQREGSATPVPPSPRTIAQKERETSDRQAELLGSWIEVITKRLEVGDYEEEDDEQEDSSDHDMPDADGPSKEGPKTDPEASTPAYPELPNIDY